MEAGKHRHQRKPRLFLEVKIWDEVAPCTNHLVHCCEQSPDEVYLKKEGFILATLRGRVHIAKEGMLVGAMQELEGSWLHCVHSQEAEK